MNAACRGEEEGKCQGLKEGVARGEGVEAKEGNDRDNWRCEVSLEWME